MAGIQLGGLFTGIDTKTLIASSWRSSKGRSTGTRRDSRRLEQSGNRDQRAGEQAPVAPNRHGGPFRREQAAGLHRGLQRHGYSDGGGVQQRLRGQPHRRHQPARQRGAVGPHRRQGVRGGSRRRGHVHLLVQSPGDDDHDHGRDHARRPGRADQQRCEQSGRDGQRAVLQRRLPSHAQRQRCRLGLRDFGQREQHGSLGGRLRPSRPAARRGADGHRSSVWSQFDGTLAGGESITISGKTHDGTAVSQNLLLYREYDAQSAHPGDQRCLWRHRDGRPWSTARSG